MIVALAGHVDHGKTSLVTALTGIETDVLREERRRGLTIDLGFAYLSDEDADAPLGFVDVPGHHRFIHNMMAGVASRQFALLAVAADDGPMPQSREHLQILDLIGLRRGAVALTKCDRAGPERIRAAEREIRALTAGTFLQDAGIHRTSARTGLGIDALRQALRSAHRRERQDRPEREFRLAVDRAFSLRGAGLVATGTVHDGELLRNGELFLFPAGDKTRVRGMRVQGRESERAAAGDRAALNLTGLKLPRIRRGCWLTETPCPERRNFAIELRVLAEFPRAVKHWLPVHVYQASAHGTGRLALLQPGALLPGERADVELICDAPLCAWHGDRLVLRDQGLDCTLGGGRVLTDLPPVQRRRPGSQRVRGEAERRRSPERLARSAAFRPEDPGQILRALLKLGPLEVAPTRSTLGLTETRFAELLAGLDAERRGNAAINPALWGQWRQDALAGIAALQRDFPDALGAMPSQLPAGIPAAHRTELLNELVAENQLARRAGAYHLPSHASALSAEQRALLDRIGPLLDVDQAPSIGDLAKTLGQPLAALQAGLKGLAERGALAQISARRFCLPQRLRGLAQCAAALGAEGPFTARQFRDAAGIGRNAAIEVLEYFDGKGFTRRTGDARTLAEQPNLR